MSTHYDPNRAAGTGQVRPSLSSNSNPLSVERSAVTHDAPTHDAPDSPVAHAPGSPTTNNQQPTTPGSPTLHEPTPNPNGPALDEPSLVPVKTQQPTRAIAANGAAIGPLRGSADPAHTHRISDWPNGGGRRWRDPFSAPPELLPPHQLDLEMCLLGAMLLEPAAVAAAREIARAEDLFDTRHQEIFATVARLADRGVEPNTVTVPDELRRRGRLDAVGGIPYIVELAGCVPTASQAAYFAERVRDLALLREVAGIGHAMARLPYERDADPAALTDQVRLRLLRVEERIRAAEPSSSAAGYRPFPTRALPSLLAETVEDIAGTMGADPAAVALPLLAAVGGAIGNTMRIALKAGWSEPAVIWSVVIGPSGSLKSPAFRAALAPVEAVQARAFAAFDSAEREHAGLLYQWDQDMDAWSKTGRVLGQPAPARPVDPSCQRLRVQDTTLEALAALLAANPRGLLLARDELAGWFKSFDAYRSGRGGDLAQWLSLFNAESLTVDRKTGDRKTLRVPMAAVSITGTIQPSTLARLLADGEYRETGLLARLLLAMPPHQPDCWSEAEPSPILAGRVELLFGELTERAVPTDGDGRPRPTLLRLADEARGLWAGFHNALALRQADSDDGDHSAMLAKLKGYAARLALLHQVVSDASSRRPSAGVVSAESLEAGLELARWFGHEAERVMGNLGDGGEDSAKRRRARGLEEVIRQAGGRVSVRWLMQNYRRRFGSTDDIRGRLEVLVSAGRGRWVGSAEAVAERGEFELTKS